MTSQPGWRRRQVCLWGETDDGNFILKLAGPGISSGPVLGPCFICTGRPSSRMAGVWSSARRGDVDIAQPRSAVGPGRQDQQDDRCRLWAMPMNLTVSYLHHQTTFGRSGEPPFAPSAWNVLAPVHWVFYFLTPSQSSWIAELSSSL